MRPLRNLFIALPFTLIATGGMTPEVHTYEYHYENVLGTSFELKVVAYSEEQADEAETTALEEMDRLENIFSTYKPTSEISQWLSTCGTEQKVSPELFEVFQLFDRWRDETNGALNASVNQASAAWKTAASTNSLPSAAQLDQLAISMRQPQWRLNASSTTAIHLTTERLALNSFVKSYIIDKVSIKLMDQPGIQGIIVNVGGDIAVSGDCRELVSVTNPIAGAENDRPIARLQLKNKFIATSGNYRRGFSVNGNWYSHIIDARTAVPASGVLSATVVADRATDAGALATAFNILAPEESAALASSVGGVEYSILTADNNVIESPGWKSLIQPGDNRSMNTTQAGDFEAAIDLELATFEGRFRRPFVAVWVENKKKESVRTIALWYNKPRWLPDLKRWFSKNQNIASDFTQIGSISSATRPAGKYTLLWDGLTDSGEPAPEGRYTIYIEAAREHGTYQLIKKDIEWNQKPGHFDLDGGVEITAASIGLHAKEK